MADTHSEILFQFRPCWKAVPEGVVWQLIKLVF